MVKELSITLNPGPVAGQYTPGSTVSGTLTIEVEEPKNYKEIVVHVNGRGCVSWSSGQSKFRAKEEYLDLEQVLWRSEDSPDGTFPAGRYTYSFQFELPVTCPFSFSSRIGNITYEVEGVVATGSLKLNHRAKHSFNVIEIVSTRGISESPAHVKKCKKVGFGPFKSGEIVHNVQLLKTAFTAGEEMPVSWHIENGSGRYVTPRCSLVEKITYHTERASLSIQQTIVSQNSAVIPPHSASGDIGLSLPIPSTCRPAMTRSNIIESGFQLIATVVIPKAINSHITIPVDIGNDT